MEEHPYEAGEAPAPAYCYRHPDRETGITCVRCERPVCTDCMIPASVGHHCPECVRQGSGTGRPPGASRPRSLAGGALTADPRLVTKVLFALNVVVFAAVRLAGDRALDGLLLFGRAATEPFGPVGGVAEGQWYRLVSSMFLHWEFWHVAMNMLGLWFLGPPLEQALGRVRFVALYLLAGLGGGALTYLTASPVQASLGASGAIFGLFGAMAVLVRRLRQDMRPVLILLAINLVFTFTGSNISWQAHIGGLVVGGLVAVAMVHAPRERRGPVQWGTCAVLALVIVGVCVLRTVQLTG